MKTTYRIIKHGAAVHLDIGFPFLWFYGWRRVRDYYADSDLTGRQQDGPFTNYGTVSAAEQALAQYQELAAFDEPAQFYFPVG